MAEQLPVDVWTLILRHVPPAERFSSCALVSQKLHKAAAAATDALELAFTEGQEQREAFKGYLQQHGRHLTRLQLRRELQQLLAQLPCSRLLDLELRASRVQLGPRNGLPGVLASCTALTRINLSECGITRGLSGLSVLVNLRDLQLVHMYATLPGTVLSCMQHLTRLQLSRVVVEDVHHVSCLSSLAVLSLDCWRSVRLASDIAMSGAPDFVLPASLHDLSLTGSRVELGPAVLSAVTQLTRLELRYFSLLGQGTSGGAALLAAVAGLHRLAALELSELRLVWPPPSAAYQALAASSRLQKLAVWGCELPADAWVQVFPPAAVCGELQRLAFSQSISAEAVSALARCCPRLRDLDVTVHSAAAVAALKPLTCLLSLILHAGRLTEADAAECVQGVAALTCLHNLRLYLYDENGRRLIVHAALLPLTALTALTRCDTNQCDLETQAGPGQPPDVWRQLQQYCLSYEDA